MALNRHRSPGFHSRCSAPASSTASFSRSARARQHPPRDDSGHNWSQPHLFVTMPDDGNRENLGELAKQYQQAARSGQHRVPTHPLTLRFEFALQLVEEAAYSGEDDR